jgi:hypothetical protein
LPVPQLIGPFACDWIGLTKGSRLLACETGLASAATLVATFPAGAEPAAGFEAFFFVVVFAAFDVVDFVVLDVVVLVVLDAAVFALLGADAGFAVFCVFAAAGGAAGAACGADCAQIAPLANASMRIPVRTFICASYFATGFAAGAGVGAVS